MKLSAGPRLGTELQKAGSADAVVGKIRGEVIERLVRPRFVRKNDLDTPAGGLGAGRHKFPASSRPTKLTSWIVFAGAGQEYVKDRQRSVDRTAYSCVFMFLVMKKLKLRIVPSEPRDPATIWSTATTRQVGQWRNVADLLEARQNVRRSVRKKRSGVKKIRTAEHIKQRVMLLGQALLGQMRESSKAWCSPRVQTMHRSGARAAASGDPRSAREWGCRSRRHAGEETRGIVCRSRNWHCGPAPRSSSA